MLLQSAGSFLCNLRDEEFGQRLPVSRLALVVLLRLVLVHLRRQNMFCSASPCAAIHVEGECFGGGRHAVLLRPAAACWLHPAASMLLQHARSPAASRWTSIIGGVQRGPTHDELGALELLQDQRLHSDGAQVRLPHRELAARLVRQHPPQLDGAPGLRLGDRMRQSRSFLCMIAEQSQGDLCGPASTCSCLTGNSVLRMELTMPAHEDPVVDKR